MLGRQVVGIYSTSAFHLGWRSLFYFYDVHCILFIYVVPFFFCLPIYISNMYYNHVL